MRQEGSANSSTGQGVVGPSSGTLLGDSGSLSVQSLDDIHHHLHSQNSQTLNFSDIY